MLRPGAIPVAEVVLDKPKDVYLSPYKAIAGSVVSEVVRAGLTPSLLEILDRTTVQAVARKYRTSPVQVAVWNGGSDARVYLEDGSNVRVAVVTIDKQQAAIIRQMEMVGVNALGMNTSVASSITK